MSNSKFYVLIVCFSYQKRHFFEAHEAEIKKRGWGVNFYLLDDPYDNKKIATRRGITDLPYQSLKLAQYIYNKKIISIISITPKAGLLVLFAKLILSLFFHKVSNIHWFTGQVWCNDKGLKKILKKIPDILLDRYSSYIFLDSIAQVNFLKKNGFKLLKSFVPNKGSINGVSDALLQKYSLRSSHATDVLRVGLVGRICEDKGIDDLMEWHTIINKKFNSIKFCFYGSVEFDAFYNADRFRSLVSDKFSNFFYFGLDVELENIYNNIDVLLLCSKREGFSNVLIEAQSFGVPVIVRNIYGVQGSFLDNQTGIKFGNLSELMDSIDSLSNIAVRERFGAAGRDFINHNFKSSLVVPIIVDKYFDLMLCRNSNEH